MRVRCRGERVFLVSFPHPRRRRTIMKRLILPALMLIVFPSWTTAPTLAQEGNAKGDLANDPPPGPSPDGTATLSFELAVEAERKKA
jgi:hypothetical protein